ncbi:radical SAM domain protein [Synechococcus sp. PCC 7335]|uniref:7,8-didemethyl-8-hydroxy-5-deazariboflavin synthase subunit CofG n=1 Tax=Synechococcus sp. (strain ATCC 29403 / PCC 7335) TaxID=91464 RepID=UPI00017ECECB|nr:7,8-didemethyl-8-hydroxy-5-deazariboflavin synthase subunit CofG [Synechococcus sp. PCC 7335]EDX86460.1 radical SAM domain protein [Synechococcus sp. PCC 7335]
MSKIVTYSPAYTLVPTYECFNRCTYCNFRQEPGTDQWMSLEKARETLTRLQSTEVIEILILSGEVHPKSARRAAWFEHIYQMCELALAMGFLPHTNVGPLSYQEMAALKQVNASMGLMLEQMTPTLMNTVHKYAPSKQPERRLEQLNFAGRLKIPFTTGILLGLGETVEDWQESLSAIAQVHQKYGHIQEVILQPHQPGERQSEVRSPCYGTTLLKAVKLAKSVLPSDITIQIPPNLILLDQALLDCIAAGATDLGGIGPIDEVNPNYSHRDRITMRSLLDTQGWKLQKRLPVYRQYDQWLPSEIAEVSKQYQYSAENALS